MSESPLPFIELFIFTYGVLFAHLGLFVLVIPGIRGPNRSAARLLTNFGALCVTGALSLLQNLQNPILDYFVYLALILIGPFSLEFIADCLNSRDLHRKVFKPAWILAGSLSVLGGTFFFTPVSERFGYAAGYLWIALLLTHVVLMERKAQGSLRRLPREIRAFYLTILGNLVLVLSMMGIQLSGRVSSMAVPWTLTIVSLVVLSAVIFRHPEVFRVIAEEAEARRYGRSRLGREEGDRLEARLGEALERDRAYAEGELRLPDLAARLGVSPQVLSELINTRFNANFNQLLNRYRIAHACGCLTAKTEKPVIDVAFRQLTGMTPREYRNAAGKGLPRPTPEEIRRGLYSSTRV